jgi:hypothetical protein
MWQPAPTGGGDCHGCWYRGSTPGEAYGGGGVEDEAGREAGAGAGALAGDGAWPSPGPGDQAMTSHTVALDREGDGW